MGLALDGVTVREPTTDAIGAEVVVGLVGAALLGLPCTVTVIAPVMSVPEHRNGSVVGYAVSHWAHNL